VVSGSRLNTDVTAQPTLLDFEYSERIDNLSGDDRRALPSDPSCICFSDAMYTLICSLHNLNFFGCYKFNAAALALISLMTFLSWRSGGEDEIVISAGQVIGVLMIESIGVRRYKGCSGL
jgi:hypothetical protein